MELFQFLWGLDLQQKYLLLGSKLSAKLHIPGVDFCYLNIESIPCVWKMDNSYSSCYEWASKPVVAF